MKTRKLGKNGPEVSAIALGTRWPAHNRQEFEDSKKQITATINEAIDAGVNFLNTADFYNNGMSELILGEVIKERRDDVFISVKTGGLINHTGHFLGLDMRPEAIKNFCTHTLTRLGVDEIDLYQPARVDPNVPIEETVGAIKDLIDEGKVKYLGLSEAGAEDLKKANSVHHVSALEIEYSLASRFIEAEILPTARELGTAVIPYATYYYGLLTGNMSFPLDKNDYKNMLPRFQQDNLAYNIEKVEQLKNFAREKGVTASQIALAFLLDQGEDIIPIVGMSKPKRIAQNLEALDITFTDEERAYLNEEFKPGAFKGDRYPPAFAKWAAS